MLAGKSKGRNLRRQSYPQRRSSKVEDIAEDSEDEDTVSVPQKSEGKLLRCLGTPPCLVSILPRETTFVTSCLLL